MLDIAQLHHLVSEQLQRPALPSVGSLAAGEMDQLHLSFAIQAASFGAFTWEAPSESHLQTLLHEPLLDANHRATTDRKCFGDLAIGETRFTLAPITHQ
jgi:hypothetical protein